MWGIGGGCVQTEWCVGCKPGKALTRIEKKVLIIRPNEYYVCVATKPAGDILYHPGHAKPGAGVILNHKTTTGTQARLVINVCWEPMPATALAEARR